MASHAAAHGLRLPLRTGDGPVRPRAAARPNFACRIGVRIPLVGGCCPGRHRGQARCRCGAAVSASPCQGEGREFESRHLLACRDRRFEAGQPLACRPSPIGRGAGLRNLAIGVRVPGTVLMESEPVRDRASLLTTARYCRGVRVTHSPRKMNQSGGWPRPETGRACKRWRSNRPSSSISGLFTPGRGADLESVQPALQPASNAGNG
jgi:hypothetical protein